MEGGDGDRIEQRGRLAAAAASSRARRRPKAHAAAATATAGSSGFTISTFDTEANILASTPSDGTVAYGTDTESYYVYDSSLGWAEFTPT